MSSSTTEQGEEGPPAPLTEHEEAERLLRLSSHGVLSTLSKRHGGWPFGSIAPYAVSGRGEPLILIARIAEHTRNILADDRVSLLVQEDFADGDPQAHARLTLLGRASPVLDDDIPDARARYLARVPDAESYFEAHDFDLFGIRIEHLRYIGGFGRIFWLDPEPFRLDPAKDPLAPVARGVIDHMNADHGEVLALFCRVFRSVTTERAEMITVDRWGFDVACGSPEQRLRFDFAEPAAPDSIRRIVVAMAARARELAGAKRSDAAETP